MIDPDAEPCAVLIETGGKQPYIFDTAKRREAVGASLLVSEAGEVWPREALGFLPASEVLLASAGTFLALVPDPAAGRSVLRAVTARALREAPGLDVYGTVVALPRDPQGWAPAVREAFGAVARSRAARAHPDLTHPVDPFARLCRTSGLPAEGLYAEARDAEPQERSGEAYAKLRAANRVVPRIARRFAGLDLPGNPAAEVWRTDLRLAQDYMSRDDGGPARVAVVHADGNGLGDILQRLAGNLDEYRAFSAGLDSAAAGAFALSYLDLLGKAVDGSETRAIRQACRDAGGGDHREPVVPVLPLVLGGDDLTVVADARVAPAFLRCYLDRLDRQVDADPAVREPLQRATGHPRFGISAGIADVTSHFPFLSAYRLADELCQEAKVVKTRLPGAPVSAWSFHQVLDGTASTLEAIRKRQEVGGALLTGAPYLEDPPDGSTGEWAGAHHVGHLKRCVGVLVERDGEGRRRLAANQVHRLRETLATSGLAAADEELQTLIRIDEATGDNGRNPSPWRRLAPGEPPTLGVPDGTHTLVPLLEAMTLADGRAL